MPSPAPTISSSTTEGWPDPGLSSSSVLHLDGDTLILAGTSPRHAAELIVSLRDLGPDVSASLWDEEIAHLGHLHHASAARILEATILEDRYFALSVLRPPGQLLQDRLAEGPLDADEAVHLAVSTLELATALHELGLSGAGTRLRSAIVVPGSDRTRYQLTTFGLHVDNDVDLFIELRELCLRILALTGGRVTARDLVLPDHLPLGVVIALRKGIGLEPTAYAHPADLAADLLDGIGRRPRGTPRSRTTTRPQFQAPVVTSDLLLKSDYAAALPQEPPPLDLVPSASRG